MKSRQSIGLTYLAYRLPNQQLSLYELERNGLLTSSAPFMRELGFEYCHIHDGDDVFEDMVVGCAEQILAESALPRDQIGWLFKYTGLEDNCTRANCGNGDILRHFRYPVAKAQHRLELTEATGVAISQQGCSGLLSAIQMADCMLRSSDMTSILCLAGDFLPRGSNREVLYNVMSDAAAAVLIQKEPVKNRIIHSYQHTVPYYWDTPEHKEELLSAYFPLAQRVIAKTLEQARLSVGDVAWFVPHNVNLRSWRILSELLGVPEKKIWSDNIARVGHTICCDHIINLQDMESQGALKKNDILVLFTFGFGANWSCMILEH